MDTLTFRNDPSICIGREAAVSDREGVRRGAGAAWSWKVGVAKRGSASSARICQQREYQHRSDHCAGLIQARPCALLPPSCVRPMRHPEHAYRPSPSCWIAVGAARHSPRPERTAATFASSSGRSARAATRIDSLGDLNFMEEPLIVVWTIRRISSWIIGS